MSDTKQDKKKLTTRLNAIKGYLESKEQKTKQDVNNLGDNFFDKAGVFTHKIGAITNDSVKKLSPKNTYEELIDLLSTSITNDNIKIANSPGKFHLRHAALQAIYDVSKRINQIVREEFLHSLHVSTTLGCGIDSVITVTDIRIKPSEFDLLGLFKIDPATKLGGVLYEKEIIPTNNYPYPANKFFYTAFDGVTYDFQSVNQRTLFSLTWDPATQDYLVTNILNQNVYNLIVDYFLSISLFEKKNLFAMITALLSGVITLDKHTEYTNNLNGLNRLITRIFAFCQQKQDKNKTQVSDNLKEIEDLPYDIKDLFDFDDEEGIIYEDDRLRLDRVLNFVDCGNLEIPTNDKTIEEFFEDFDRNENNPEHVGNLLNDLSYDVFQQSNGGIPLELIKIHLNLNFIKILPKALALLLLSPKAIFPFVLLRRIFGATIQNPKDLLKIIYKTIFKIIRRIFEEFIAVFFRLIKKEIVRMINVIIQDTISEIKIKKTSIIRHLLDAFKILAATLQEGDLSVCGGLIKTIMNLLSARTNIPFSVPTPLLIAATQRSGFSNIRAFINVVEELEKAGIPTGDLYGQPNKHIIQHLAHIRGVERERDENGVVNATVISGTVQTPAGPGIMIPGTIKIVGING